MVIHQGGQNKRVREIQLKRLVDIGLAQLPFERYDVIKSVGLSSCLLNLADTYPEIHRLTNPETPLSATCTRNRPRIYG